MTVIMTMMTMIDSFVRWGRCILIVYFIVVSKFCMFSLCERYFTTKQIRFIFPPSNPKFVIVNQFFFTAYRGQLRIGFLCHFKFLYRPRTILDETHGRTPTRGSFQPPSVGRSRHGAPPLWPDRMDDHQRGIDHRIFLPGLKP